MKKISTYFLFFCTVSVANKGFIDPFFALPALGISTVLIGGCIKKWRFPRPFKPSIEKLNTYTLKPTSSDAITNHVSVNQLVKTIYKKKNPLHAHLRVRNTHKVVSCTQGVHLQKNEPVVFISSRGYAKRDKPDDTNIYELVKRGGGIVAAHILWHDNIIDNTPCITFDYPDERSYFNFGQNLDCACIQTVWNAAIAQNPDVKIVGIGDCRGAKALLSFATQRPKNLAALILISPFVSSKDMTAQVAHHYLSWLPKADALLHTFFTYYFPSYNPDEDRLLQQLQTIGINVPIFIGHRKGDYLASDTSVMQLRDILQKAGNHQVDFVAVSDTQATHSRITPIKELQYRVNQFLAKHNLPHKEIV